LDRNDLYGQAGADTFDYNIVDTVIDFIQDFSTVEGDKLDLSDILSGTFDPLVDAITDFVQITDNGTHSALSVDADGGADNFVQIAQLNNTTGLTDEAALVSNGTLLV